jgi:hypothetical protein
MKRIKIIGGFCYFISFLFALTLFLNIDIGISKGLTLLIFISLGGFGFLFNIVSYSKDKNQMSNLTYWLGSFFVFGGLLFKIFHFPFSISLIIIGSLTLFISIFILRRGNNKDKDNEILDQF